MQSASETLVAFFRRAYRPRLAGRSVKSERQYVTQINHFRRFLGREPTLADLGDETVSLLLGWIVANGRTAATANKARAHLLALWRLAARKRLVSDFPDVRPLREPERIPLAWTRPELRRLLAACRRQRGMVCGVPAGLWWYSLHLVLWDTGERIGALLAARWSWLSMRGRWFLVPAEARKMKTRDRLYRLHPATVQSLRLVKTPAAGLIWPFPAKTETLWARYAAILKAAGLPTDRWSKFHRMRRSVASHAAAAGLDPQELLDHTARRVTRAYLDPRIVGQSQSASNLWRPG